MSEKQCQRIINQFWLPFLNQFFGNIGRSYSYYDPHSLRDKISKILSLDETFKEHDLARLFSSIVQHTPNVWSPNHLNYLYSSPDPIGLIADWFVTLINTNVHAYEASPALALIEIELVKKLANTIGYDSNSDGIFCPGGSYSNMYAMYLAREKLCSGKEHATTKAPVVFASEHCHYSIDKSARVLGIAPKNIMKVSCDSKGRMLPTMLERGIEKAISSGKNPFFINATLGTTVFGAFDPISDIRKIASEYGAWLHVDAAWGGGIFFSEGRKNMYTDIERSDSVTWDLHKAMKSPIYCSVMLVRNGSNLTAPFEVDSSYLLHKSDDEEIFDLGVKTLQCSRRADAFKFWLTWKTGGNNYLTSQVEKRFLKTEEFLHALKERSSFKVYDETPDFWNICFWYLPDEFRSVVDITLCSDKQKRILDKLTCDIFTCLRKDSRIMLNFARIKDYPAFIRLIVGDKLTRENIVKILDIIESIGNLLSKELPQILISGGDNRLELDDQEQNYVMVSPKPVHEATVLRSSCTGSSISVENFRNMENLLDDLRSARISFRESMLTVHNRIRKILKIDSNNSIVTIPSGTEAEFIPLLVAKAKSGYHSRIVNIMTAAEEIGSHSATAAAGLYFSTHTPSGTIVKAGKKIGGISENINVVKISNQSLSVKNSDDYIKWLEITERYLFEKDTLVVLHIVDSSKLGRRVDIIDDVEELRTRFPRKLLVVMDSCQSRTDALRTRYYLQLGYMVMITGSKFEEGPPFSGAVIIPFSLIDSLNKNSFTGLLSGLGHYITEYDVSGDMEKMICKYLPSWMNFGLLVRWSCALNNWENFRSIPSAKRISIIERWVEGFIKLLNQYPRIKIYSGGEKQPGGVGGVNTIISFQVLSNGRLMKTENLRSLYFWLNRDMAHRISSEVQIKESENKILRRRFLIGQPVDMGSFGVLRIALGAMLVRKINQCGLKKVLIDDNALLMKIDLLVKYFEYFDL